MADFNYEIVEHIGVLSEGSKGWQKELNKVSWNGAAPKYDIRDWAPDHEKMGKGVTLTEEEARELSETRSRALRENDRIDYEADAFALLKDRSSFTIYELKRIYESIKNRSLDTANFRKSFFRSYLSTGRVRDRGEKREDAGRKPAELYEFIA